MQEWYQKDISMIMTIIHLVQPLERLWYIKSIDERDEDDNHKSIIYGGGYPLVN